MQTISIIHVSIPMRPDDYVHVHVHVCTYMYVCREELSCLQLRRSSPATVDMRSSPVLFNIPFLFDVVYKWGKKHYFDLFNLFTGMYTCTTHVREFIVCVCVRVCVYVCVCVQYARVCVYMYVFV